MMHPSEHRVAIIIINWNSYEVTKQTIQSLRKSRNQEYTIILIDNASIDGSGEALRNEFLEIHYIASKSNLGFAGGNNLGIQFAIEKNYQYILLLNPDVEVESDFLEPLFKKFESDQTIGAVQPLIYFHHDKERIWNAGGKYYPILGDLPVLAYRQKDPGQTFKSKNVSIDWITGCAFMIKTEVIKKAGYLNEMFFMYYEDADWSLQIKKAGYTLAYVPESIIYHKVGDTQKSKNLNEGTISHFAHYYHIRSRILFLKRNTPIYYIPSVLIYQTLSIFLISCYFLSRGRWNKWQWWNKGIWHGITGNIVR